MDELRSGKQQLKDELDADYRRMTDPDEQENARLETHRETFAAEMSEDAGL